MRQLARKMIPQGIESVGFSGAANYQDKNPKKTNFHIEKRATVLDSIEPGSDFLAAPQLILVHHITSDPTTSLFNIIFIGAEKKYMSIQRSILMLVAKS